MVLRRLWIAALLASLLLPSVAGAQSSGSAHTTGYRWDGARRLVGEIKPDPDAGGSLVSVAVRYTYNGEGQLIRVEEGRLAAWQSESVLPAYWSGFTLTKKIEIAYDAAGRRVRDTAYDSAGAAVGVTQFGYDTSDRLECTAVRMNPAVYGSLPSSACGLGTTGGDGADRITRNVYDAAGQVLKVQKAYGTARQQDYATYTYSANGKQTSLIDANGNKAAMGYDGFDRQVTWVFPNKTSGSVPAACAGNVSEQLIGGVWVAGALDARGSSDDCEKYGYDRNGNRRKLSKRDGQVILYSYDAGNRMTAKDLPGTGIDVAYGYDLRNLQTSALYASSGQGVTSGYDKAGRLTSSSMTIGTTRTVTYQRDANGNRTRVTHPDGQYFTYGYDNAGRLTVVKENGGTTIASYGYDLPGRLSTLARGGVTTTLGYDAASRPNSLADNLAGTASDVTSTFSYNAATQIKGRTRNSSAYAFTGYANVNRGYTVNGLNQYSAAGNRTLVNDLNGNLWKDHVTGAPTNGTEYLYDTENRLTLVKTLAGATTATLSYDPMGRLYEVVGGGSTTRFLYDGDELIAEYDGSGTLLRRYVHGGGDDDPLIWYEGSAVGSTNRRSLQSDHQGSIVSVADSAGTMLAVNAYDEYGIPKGADGQVPANLGRFQYTGQAWLDEIKMYYYKARIYSPTLGRFLQTDPIGYKDQVNLYAYVGNDPMSARDSTGLDTEIIVMGYELGDAPGVGRYGHAYVVIVDTDTGKTRVLRGGPSQVISDTQRTPSNAILNLGMTGEDGKPITVAAQTDPAGLSPDWPTEGHPMGVALDRTVLSDDFSTVNQRANVFVENVNNAGTPYRFRGPNSNSVAGTFFRQEAGRGVNNNSGVAFPGIEQTVGRKPEPAKMCTNTPGGTAVWCN